MGDRKKILLVDDSPTVTCVLRTYMMGHGWEFIHEPDGERGLRRALLDRPDVIVSDVEMPVRSGLELCAAVKAAPGLAHVRVILISSKWTSARRQDAIRAGVDGWLPKPVQEQALISLVTSLLSAESSTSPTVPQGSDPGQRR